MSTTKPSSTAPAGTTALGDTTTTTTLATALGGWHRWHGWGMGCSYTSGRFTFSIGIGPRRGWWGPGGYRPGYRRGYNRGYNAAKRDAKRNIYQNKDNANRVAKSAGPVRAPPVAAAAEAPEAADAASKTHV